MPNCIFDSAVLTQQTFGIANRYVCPSCATTYIQSVGNLIPMYTNPAYTKTPNTVVAYDISSPRIANFVVAASNSPPAVRNSADYVCDGVADNAEIQMAIDAAPNGGSVILSEGVYNLSSGVRFLARQHLRFQGSGRVTINHTGTDSVFIFDGQGFPTGGDSTGPTAWNTFGGFYVSVGLTTEALLKIYRGCYSNHFSDIRAVGPDTDRLPPSAVFLDDGGVFFDNTSAAINDIDDDVTLLPAVPQINDAHYVCYTSSPYRTVMYRTTTAGVGVWAVVWEYWNGKTWVAHSNVVDETAPFDTATGLHTTASFQIKGAGHVSWNLPTDWAPTTVNGINGYWTRARVRGFQDVAIQPLAARMVLAINAPTVGILITSNVLTGGAPHDHGNFNNHFQDIDIARFPVGAKIETTGDMAARMNSNANLFTNVSLSSANIGLKINGGEANTFIGHDIENNTVSMDLNHFIDTTFVGGWFEGNPTGALTNVARGRAFVFGGLGPELPINNGVFTQFSRHFEQPWISVTTGGVPSGFGPGNLGFVTFDNLGFYNKIIDAYPIMPLSNHLVGRSLHFGTNGWTETPIAGIGGQGALVVYPQTLKLKSSSAQNAGVIASTEVHFLHGRMQTQALHCIDWGRALFIKITFTRKGADTQSISYFQLKGAVTEGSLEDFGIGLSIVDSGVANALTITGESYGASGRATVDISSGRSIGNGIDIGIAFIPSIPTLDFFVNGNLVESITNSTKLPTGISPIPNYFVVSHKNGASGVASEFYVSAFDVWQGETSA